MREALQSLSRDFGIDLDRAVRQAAAQAARGRCCSAQIERRADSSKAIRCPTCAAATTRARWAEQADLEPYPIAPRRARPAAATGSRPQSLSVRVKGRTIADYVDLPIAEALQVFDALQLTDREAIIAERILREIQDRLRFLNDVGVGYLTLGRSAATLSGGEGQRIRLATQIGANLTGVLYVLDEPSIGLHQRDNRKLLATLARLRDLGNTVIVVEHDEETIRTADYVIDLGPGRRRARRPGHLPGHAGEPARERIGQRSAARSTGAYLTGQRVASRRPGAAAGARRASS